MSVVLLAANHAHLRQLSIKQIWNNRTSFANCTTEHPPELTVLTGFLEQ